MRSMLQGVGAGHLKGNGLGFWFSGLHMSYDAIKRWGHLANFHWTTNLSVMTKVPYK